MYISCCISVGCGGEGFQTLIYYVSIAITRSCVLKYGLAFPLLIRHPQSFDIRSERALEPPYLLERYAHQSFDRLHTWLERQNTFHHT